ncbi:Putative auto-transporter adhesin, head GIN domain [Cyclobacterium lianum]|uniref:Putative auto-transporter adhesin, head GIN domain n=1 Tax=Cyclobacterium lianum TaxID=388280 RepID=A0A1M7NJE3_9BACT|nr:head GIN domain-containing protein [Cyclobacterium lianum]SHN03968.1 Putative auto-transporter adhesin, head GIN domain [Cyclobacterium lianum]
MKSLLPTVLFLALIFPILLAAQQQETRKLSSFNQVKTSGSWHLTMKQGVQPSVTLRASNIDLEKVLTTVENEVLEIRLDKGRFRKPDLELTVVYTELQGISNRGSGDILLLDGLETDNDVNIELSGSGNLDIPALVSRGLNVRQSGSGVLSIHEGAVQQVNIHQSGSGDFLAGNVQAEAVVVRKSGSGNTALGNVLDLTVDASGSGNIVYQGSPRMEQIKMSGSGTLIQE